MRITAAILCGFLLDLLLGDPVIPHFPHPVVIMGRCIYRLEALLRGACPKTARGERTAGTRLVIIMVLGTFLVTFGVYLGLNAIHPLLGFAIQTIWCWQALAMRDLTKESRNVYSALISGDISASRIAVSRIVGRDTANLTAEGVTKAAVETVAENFSDGVIAPLFYMLIGGAPLAMICKAINTMDSMVGYKNEKYINFGRPAAKLDDIANFLPSRISALLWIACSGRHMGRAYKIWRRDRRNHASPNSAQCEAACAGELGVMLGGPASYFGRVYDKPTIGDDTRPIQPEDILRANRTMHRAGVLGLVLGLAIRFLILR